MAVLLLTYAYALPGPLLWPELGAASPSIEGIQRGALRAGRLALLLVGLALLLAYTPRARLIYGLYVLARPLTWLGFDRRALAVRLGLTLEYVEHAPKTTRWLDMLRMPLSDNGAPAIYNLEAERWRTRDGAVILAGLLLLWIVLA